MSKPKIIQDIGNTSQLGTSSKDLVGAVNEVRQGLEVLSSNRGYLTTFRSDTDANTFLKNGKYTGKGSNFPDDGYWNIEVTAHGDSLITQVAVKIADGGGFKSDSSIMFRNLYVDTWTTWKEITDSDDLKTYFGIPQVIAMNGGDANNMLSTIKRFVFNVSNTPTVNGGYGMLEVYNLNSGGFAPSNEKVAVQRFTSWWDGSIYSRTYRKGSSGSLEWSDWQKIANTTRASFSCTATTNVTINYQNCYILNGEFFISLRAYKTDGTVFATGANVIAVNGITPNFTVVGSAMGRTDTTTSAWLYPLTCYGDTAKNIVVNINTSTIKEIYITIKGAI